MYVLMCRSSYQAIIKTVSGFPNIQTCCVGDENVDKEPRQQQFKVS